MPRSPRPTNSSGYYHIVLQSPKELPLFADNQDREYFLQILNEEKETFSIEIYAYCLMDHHLHLLIYDPRRRLSPFMRSLQLSYVRYFNKRYERKGSLFAGRFKSEVIEKESSLLTVFQYIHQHPKLYGLEEKPGDYRWSSCRDYLSENPDKNFADTAFITSLFNKQEDLKAYLHSKCPSLCMEYYPAAHIPDHECLRLILYLSSQSSLEQLLALPEQDLYTFLQSIIKTGIPVGQLSRITGIGVKRLGKILNMA